MSQLLFNVLIIEDNEMDRELYQLAFDEIQASNKTNKMQIQYLTSELEIEEFIKSDPLNFNMVICDLIIDEKKSFDTIAKMKEKNKELFILAMSSSAYEGDILKVYENGVTDFSMKPNSYKNLRELLLKALTTYCPDFFSAGTVK